MTNGNLLKLVSETEGVSYFKILSIQTTSCRIQQVCQIKKGKVNFKYRTNMEANIYKSEIGNPYINIEKSEIDQLRQLIQKKMMEDFQLLIEVYSQKLKLVH